MFRLIVAVALLSLAMGARNTMFYRVETKTVDLTHFLKDPTKTAVVFADQETLKEEKMSELWKRLWNDAPLRFCIDKGADRLFHFKDDLQPPTMITGKLDRMEMETLKFFEGKETRLQDTYDEMETDLLTTLKVLGREDLDEIDFVVILGGFEGRFDRVLGHLDALMRANLMLPVPTMTLHGHDLIMVLPEGEWTLDLDRTMLTGTCGFAPLEQKKTMVTTTGFKWNLENEEMGFGKKISTSNEVESDQLKMHTDGALVFTADGPGRRFPIHWAFVGIFLAAPGTPLRREQPPLPEALGIRKTINELDCVSDNTRRVESAKAFYRLFKDHLEGVLRGKVGEILEEEDVEDNAACGKICGILRDLDRVLLFDLEDGEEFRRRLNEGPLEVPRKRKRRSEKERFYGIHTLIMLSLQDVVFEKVAFQKVDAALKLIRDDREGKEGLDMVLVKEFADALTVFAIDYGRKSISYPNPNADAVIQGMVLRLQRSVESFGRRLVEDVAACFEKTKADLEREEDLVRYLRKVELIMEEETQRSRHYLNHRWRGALQKAIATMFLEERSEAMASEFRGSMATNRREVAKLIYKLSSKTQGAKEVREIFSEIVTIEVRRAIAALKVEEQTDPRLFITTAMGKADEYRNLLAEVFDSAAEMVDVFERAFEEVLGKNATVELLARFAD